MRRLFLCALLAALLTGGLTADDHWIATWGASPSPAHPDMEQMRQRKLVFDDQTVRLITHITLGGREFRIRLSNAFGKEAVLIDGAHAGLRAEGSAIREGTDQAISFSGRPWIRIPPGAEVLSDPIALEAPDSSDLAVSLYLPAKTGPASTVHYSAQQTSYVAAGNVLGSRELAESAAMTSWPYLVGVDVMAPEETATLVTFGDSITDGAKSTVDSNRRWPNVLADRLLAKRKRVAVVNAGIGGNRILHDGAGASGPQFGPSALSRLERDVLSVPGVKWLLVLEGVNDLGHPGGAAPMSEDVTAEDVIAGLMQIAERGHELGLKVYGATIMPFAPAGSPKEAKRLAINEWIRTGGAFDGVVDFDEVVRSKEDFGRFEEKYDSGDHLHPSDAGYQAMGEAVELSWFSR